MTIINQVALWTGYFFIILLIITILYMIYELISRKIADIKDVKRTIKKGTVMFIDGERAEIKTDLNIRFKKRKVIICECDELNLLEIKGYCFNNTKDFAQSDFEHKLLEMYKSDKKFMSRFIGE